MKRQNLIYTLLLISQLLVGQTWQWAKSGNGNKLNKGYSSCTDLNGNVIITGVFTSNVLTFGTFTLANSSSASAYIVKYDSNGNVLWVKGTSGLGGAAGTAVSTDNTGNIYLTGYYGAPSITIDSYTLTNSGNWATFLIKFDSNGNALWVKNSIGLADDGGLYVCNDPFGNSIIVGYFTSPTIAFDTFTLTKSPSINDTRSDLFLVKFDNFGNVLWANKAFGVNNEWGVSVNSDLAGNVLICGTFNSPTMTFNNFSLNNSGYNNAFIAKYDSTGNFLWAKNPIGYEILSKSVTSDLQGNHYVVGEFGISKLTIGTFTLNSPSGYATFLAKLSPNGDVIWIKKSSGNSDFSYSVCTDANNVYICGRFAGSTSFGPYSIIASPGSPDPLFIARYDLEGNVTFATSLSNSGGQSSICVDQNSNVCIAGSFINMGSSPSFVVGTHTLNSTSYENIFVAKLICPIVDNIKLFSKKDNVASIFPNPVTNTFRLEVKNKNERNELIIVNSLGQILYRQNIVAATTEIDISSLPQGMYNCILMNDDGLINGSKQDVLKVIKN